MHPLKYTLTYVLLISLLAFTSNGQSLYGSNGFLSLPFLKTTLVPCKNVSLAKVAPFDIIRIHINRTEETNEAYDTIRLYYEYTLTGPSQRPLLNDTVYEVQKRTLDGWDAFGTQPFYSPDNASNPSYISFGGNYTSNDGLVDTLIKIKITNIKTGDIYNCTLISMSYPNQSIIYFNFFLLIVAIGVVAVSSIVFNLLPRKKLNIIDIAIRADVTAIIHQISVPSLIATFSHLQFMVSISLAPVSYSLTYTNLSTSWLWAYMVFPTKTVKNWINEDFHMYDKNQTAGPYEIYSKNSIFDASTDSGSIKLVDPELNEVHRSGIDRSMDAIMWDCLPAFGTQCIIVAMILGLMVILYWATVLGWCAYYKILWRNSDFWRTHKHRLIPLFANLFLRVAMIIFLPLVVMSGFHILHHYTTWSTVLGSIVLGIFVVFGALCVVYYTHFLCHSSVFEPDESPGTSKKSRIENQDSTSDESPIAISISPLFTGVQRCHSYIYSVVTISHIIFIAIATGFGQINSIFCWTVLLFATLCRFCYVACQRPFIDKIANYVSILSDFFRLASVIVISPLALLSPHADVPFKTQQVVSIAVLILNWLSLSVIIIHSVAINPYFFLKYWWNENRQHVVGDKVNKNVLDSIAKDDGGYSHYLNLDDNRPLTPHNHHAIFQNANRYTSGSNTQLSTHSYIGYRGSLDNQGFGQNMSVVSILNSNGERLVICKQT